MDDFKNRLLEFVELRYGESQRSFERRCGLTQGTIPSIGAKGPSVEVLCKISNACKELDLNWLVTGEGDMLKGHFTSSPYSVSNNASFAKNSDDFWKLLCDEKDKRIVELERTIQILMNK